MVVDFPGAVGAEVAEHLARLHMQVETGQASTDDTPGPVPGHIGLGELGELDRRSHVIDIIRVFKVF
ncbi:hypothetical protein GCM10009727_13450 [Actinomadura napierensis]|uniref:Uncharacterized protein n=1 Tax=Actinomadura napierensis TaxID=267854 RepID=A0ABP5K520_9ACTN